MKFGRLCIAYNSLFVALIRFVYIVYDQKANQWDFERVGKRFQIASIAIPIGIETIGSLTGDGEYWSKSSDRFKDCIAFYQGLNSTDNVQLPVPVTAELAMRYLPEPLVLTIYYIYMTITLVVILNITEAFLYFKIFQTIRR